MNNNINNQIIGYDAQTGQPIYNKKNKKIYIATIISIILFIIYVILNIMNILDTNKSINETGDSSLGIAYAFGFIFSFPILLSSFSISLKILIDHFSRKQEINKVLLFLNWCVILLPIISFIIMVIIIPIISAIIG